WNLHDYVTTYEDDSMLKDKKLQKKMDRLITEDDLSVNASDKNYINTELTLTQHFIMYMLDNYEKGYVKRKEMERFIHRKKEDPDTKKPEQLLMNMDRMRCLANNPSGNLIVVNIPEFVLHVYEGKQKAFDIDVVVGKEGHNTLMFNGDLNQVVFSPYWNVPPS